MFWEWRYCDPSVTSGFHGGRVAVFTHFLNLFIGFQLSTMPVLVLQPPSLPPLQTYIALSCLSLAWCFLYARDTLETVENAGLTNHAQDLGETGGEPLGDTRGATGLSGGANESERSRYLFGIQADDGEIVKLCRIMMADVWSVLVSYMYYVSLQGSPYV